MINLEVKISQPQKTYPITINQDKIENLRTNILKNIRGQKFLVVISKRVYKLYAKQLGFSKDEIFVLNNGEKEKNFKNYQKILNRALKMKLTRKDAIIAIGGGVVGDIAGFAASTYMRGIDYIQVPTTLLACVDSSVGGKVAVNSDFGKNLIGCFYQPKAVLINLNFLKTLDERQYKTGLGEVVKYLFIEKSCLCSEELHFSNFINENMENILTRNLNTLERLVEICIKLKISVVEKDEQEKGLRRILNFGHTYGHAVENLTKYKKYTHGEAVVAGIKFAFNLAEKKGLIDKNYRYLAEDILTKFNFKPVRPFPTDKVIEVMKLDKKAEFDKIAFILPTTFSTVDEILLSSEEIYNL